MNGNRMNFMQTTETTSVETSPNPEISAQPLRVALDARLIHHSGIGCYLAGLLSGFAQIQSPIEWTLIGPQCEIPEGIKVRNRIGFDAPLYSRREFFSFPTPRDVDLLHYPHYNLPRVSVPNIVVTVHDPLLHLRYGSFHKRFYQRIFLRRLKSSRVRITANSEKTRDELCAQTSIPVGNVAIIHLGPGKPPPDTSHEVKPISLDLSDGQKIIPPWFLAVGIDQPHKNMDFLIAAFAMWHLRRREGPPLVWVGPKKESLAELSAKIPAHARNQIILEPYAEGERLEQFYAGAAGLIFPSLDEGFGFPPLEAMARGIPVLCSRRRPMTDLLGNAPLWFDPEDSATLWRALDVLADEPRVREEAIARGRKQAEKYSWAETARQTFQLYSNAAGR